MMMKQWKSLCKVCKGYRQGGNKGSRIARTIQLERHIIDWSAKIIGNTSEHPETSA